MVISKSRIEAVRTAAENQERSKLKSKQESGSAQFPSLNWRMHGMAQVRNR